MLERERRGYELDAKINQRGLPIDMDLVSGAILSYERHDALLQTEASLASGIWNPNSVFKLQAWLEQNNVYVPNLNKGTVRDLLEDDGLPADVRRILEIRLETGKTSIKKYYAIRKQTSADGRLRNTLQYMGAGRTGRWAGRGLQLQNLPRGTLKPDELHGAVNRIRTGGFASMEDLQSCIRPCVRAPYRHLIAAADLASIESRVVAWLAEEETMLAVFAEGRDTYLDYGQQLLGKPESEITKAERTYCKPAVLGCFAADTPVLTDRGFVPIVDVLPSDLLWDGVEWCAHDGVLDQGIKEVDDLWGVQVTPDHLVLCGGTWSPVSSILKESGTAELAINTGASALSGFGSQKHPEPAGSVSAVLRSCARAGGPDPLPITTFATAGQLNAAHAEKEYQHKLSRNGAAIFQTEKCATLGSTDTAPWSPAATKTAPAAGTITAHAGSLFATNGAMIGRSFFSGSANSQATQTSLWSWIAGITAEAIHRTTAALWAGGLIPATPAPTGTFGSRGAGTRSPCLLNSVRIISAHPTFGAFCSAASVQSKLRGKARPKQKARTYDVVNAGPRNRFVILTARGPLVAHNCAYQMGAKGLVSYAAGMGVQITEEDSQEAVAAFRSRYSGLPVLWALLDQAAREVTLEGGRKEVGPLAFEYDKPWLFMRLPSGRRLCYLHPRIEMREAPWGAEIPTMSYMGLDQVTRQWKRQYAFGGKWTEQACQGVARDVLLDGLLLADERGFDIIGSVHDEILAVVPKNSDEFNHKTLAQAMSAPVPWADDQLHLDADGFSDIFYRKD